VKGTTEPAPGRKAVLSPVPLHPVISVNVKPGDRVKKGQLLVELDDDEAQADLRAKQAALAEMRAGLARLRGQPREEERAELRAVLEAAKVSAKEAQDLLKRMIPLYRSGSLPQATYYSARASLRKLQADERAAEARQRQLLKKPVELEIAEIEAKVAAAQAAVAVARSELEHYSIRAPIDGVVNWLDVYPGTVSRPGTTVWGEILDLREIDVRCDLTAEQAERVAVGQTAEVRNGGKGERWSARVVFVGIAADRRTGRVPVRVRLKGARLRCYVEVVVRLGNDKQG
jgi:multidrug resistance efflux pump